MENAKWLKIWTWGAVLAIAATTAAASFAISGMWLGLLVFINICLGSYKVKTARGIPRCIYLNIGMVVLTIIFTLFNLPYPNATAFMIQIVVTALLPRI